MRAAHRDAVPVLDTLRDAAVRSGAWQGLLRFPEHVHGDTGAGLGAMHQTGWTAEVINVLLAPPPDTAPA